MTFAKLVESYGYVYDALILRLLGLVLYTVMVGLLIFAAVRYVVFKSEPPLSSRKKLSVVPPTSVPRGLPRRLRLSKRKESPLDTARSDRSGHCRCFQAKAQPPDIPVFTSAPEARALSSAGATRLHRSYDPCPTPAGIAVQAGVEAATLLPNGSPRLPASPFRRAVPTTPADRTGARVDCFPVHAAFPVLQAGRHPHLYFRGLLGFTRVTARRIAQPPKAAFVTRLQPSGCPSRPLVSYRTNRQFSGWDPPLLVNRAFGAHRRIHEICLLYKKTS